MSIVPRAYGPTSLVSVTTTELFERGDVVVAVVVVVVIGGSVGWVVKVDVNGGSSLIGTVEEGTFNVGSGV